MLALLGLVRRVPWWVWAALAIIAGLFGLKLIWRREWTRDRQLEVQERALEQARDREELDNELKTLPDDELRSRADPWVYDED